MAWLSDLADGQSVAGIARSRIMNFERKYVRVTPEQQGENAGQSSATLRDLGALIRRALSRGSGRPVGVGGARTVPTGSYNRSTTGTLKIKKCAGIIQPRGACSEGTPKIHPILGGNIHE